MGGTLKATIHYTDENSLRLALNGGKYWSCLWDLDQWCRGELKHGIHTTEAEEVLEYVRQFIHDRIDMEEIE